MNVSLIIKKNGCMLGLGTTLLYKSLYTKLALNANSGIINKYCIEPALDDYKLTWLILICLCIVSYDISCKINVQFVCL